MTLRSLSTCLGYLDQTILHRQEPEDVPRSGAERFSAMNPIEDIHAAVRRHPSLAKGIGPRIPGMTELHEEYEQVQQETRGERIAREKREKEEAERKARGEGDGKPPAETPKPKPADPQVRPAKPATRPNEQREGQKSISVRQWVQRLLKAKPTRDEFGVLLAALLTFVGGRALIREGARRGRIHENIMARTESSLRPALHTALDEISLFRPDSRRQLGAVIARVIEQHDRAGGPANSRITAAEWRAAIEAIMGGIEAAGNRGQGDYLILQGMRDDIPNEPGETPEELKAKQAREFLAGVDHAGNLKPFAEAVPQVMTGEHPEIRRAEAIRLLIRASLLRNTGGLTAQEMQWPEANMTATIRLYILEDWVPEDPEHARKVGGIIEAWHLYNDPRIFALATRLEPRLQGAEGGERPTRMSVQRQFREEMTPAETRTAMQEFVRMTIRTGVMQGTDPEVLALELQRQRVDGHPIPADLLAEELGAMDSLTSKENPLVRTKASLVALVIAASDAVPVSTKPATEAVPPVIDLRLPPKAPNKPGETGTFAKNATGVVEGKIDLILQTPAGQHAEHVAQLLKEPTIAGYKENLQEIAGAHQSGPKAEIVQALLRGIFVQEANAADLDATSGMDPPLVQELAKLTAMDRSLVLREITEEKLRMLLRKISLTNGQLEDAIHQEQAIRDLVGLAEDSNPGQRELRFGEMVHPYTPVDIRLALMRIPQVSHDAALNAWATQDRLRPHVETIRAEIQAAANATENARIATLTPEQIRSMVGRIFDALEQWRQANPENERALRRSIGRVEITRQVTADAGNPQEGLRLLVEAASQAGVPQEIRDAVTREVNAIEAVPAVDQRLEAQIRQMQGLIENIVASEPTTARRLYGQLGMTHDLANHQNALTILAREHTNPAVRGIARALLEYVNDPGEPLRPIDFPPSSIDIAAMAGKMMEVRMGNTTILLYFVDRTGTVVTTTGGRPGEQMLTLRLDSALGEGAAIVFVGEDGEEKGRTNAVTGLRLNEDEATKEQLVAAVEPWARKHAPLPALKTGGLDTAAPRPGEVPPEVTAKYQELLKGKAVEGLVYMEITGVNELERTFVLNKVTVSKAVHFVCIVDAQGNHWVFPNPKLESYDPSSIGKIFPTSHTPADNATVRPVLIVANNEGGWKTRPAVENDVETLPAPVRTIQESISALSPEVARERFNEIMNRFATLRTSGFGSATSRIITSPGVQEAMTADVVDYRAVVGAIVEQASLPGVPPEVTEALYDVMDMNIVPGEAAVTATPPIAPVESLTQERAKEIMRTMEDALRAPDAQREAQTRQALERFLTPEERALIRERLEAMAATGKTADGITLSKTFHESVQGALGILNAMENTTPPTAPASAVAVAPEAQPTMARDALITELRNIRNMTQQTALLAKLTAADIPTLRSIADSAPSKLDPMATAAEALIKRIQDRPRTTRNGQSGNAPMFIDLGRQASRVIDKAKATYVNKRKGASGAARAESSRATRQTMSPPGKRTVIEPGETGAQQQGEKKSIIGRGTVSQATPGERFKETGARRATEMVEKETRSVDEQAKARSRGKTGGRP